ncbi:hypothetical protein [Sphingomonas morindae]|uniref:Uncharacterized protein n=1 Tax=Sphingomonas morindae TaxID=1541170 RepID=A0ABY4X4K3_9SPHN|nr:hypothetical protein [Sphingomonas morindae]USI71827.1 hypothetical protein LHA26_10895 [Sphingomonas morindae]
MRCLDRHCPRWHIRHRHGRVIAAPPERVIAAAAAFRPERLPLAAALLALRLLPARLMGAGPLSFRREDFTVLDQATTYIVFGLAGRFWRADPGLVPLRDAADFAQIRAGVARLAIGYSASPHADGACLVTETRIHCADADAQRAMRRYGRLIRPASGLIRRATLGAIARAATAPAPGARSMPAMPPAATPAPAAAAMAMTEAGRGLGGELG